MRGNPGGRLNDIQDLYSYLTADSTFQLLEKTKVTRKSSVLMADYLKSVPKSAYIVVILTYPIYASIMLLKTKKADDGNYYFKISFSNQNKTILIEKYIYDDSILGKKLVQYFIIQLDKFGNMIERKYFNHNNSIVKTQEFIYTYDKKGNVLKKESIDNGKLYEIITNGISYKN